MTDLIEMIDGTTKRLLRKVDEISIGNPADVISDKKEENYKKEIERLQKQLDIAKEALDYYSDMRKYNKSGWCSTDIGYQKAWEASLKIKELNK